MDSVGLPPLATAEVIAVGSELLGTTRLDTNSLFLAGRLGDLGVQLCAKSVVGDERVRLRDVFLAALSRSDLVILSGGLGPTDDDLTREVVSDALGRPMTEDAGILAHIHARFARRGLRMPDVNRRQAMVPDGARVLDNPNGTAPGLLIEHGTQIVVLLPGPPRELQPMFEAVCASHLTARAGRQWTIHRETLFVAGRGESHVEEVAQPIYSRWTKETPPIETTILAMPGQVELHLMLRSHADADRTRLRDARDELMNALGSDVFSSDGRPMEEVVGGLLCDRGLTISAAESCTGGLLMARLTDVPGSSAYVLGGAVTYSNELKTVLANVPKELIEAHGAVSEPVAVAMADGIRARSGASLGLGITGIAGPGGATAEKPVGTVAIALSGDNLPARVRTFWFIGGRPQIRFQAAQAAMDMVRRTLLKV